MKTIIIAEAGVNHNGDFELAKELILVAADAGADYVKFQTFKADKLVNRSAPKAAYQAKNINDGDASQYAMLKKLEMPFEWHQELISYADSKGISFLSTGFDEDSVDFLDELGCTLFKIPSGEITNKPYLEHIAQKGKPVILSTGMGDIEEIGAAIRVLTDNGILKNQISVLHCNTEYPTPMGDVNLLAMNHIKTTFDIEVGYSDHTEGIEVPIAAVALGARIIEKHFTLSKDMPGPDHVASLEPHELKEMVRAIRNIEKAISGDGIKKPSLSEAKNKEIVRKSLHFSRDLRTGDVLKESDLIALRPGNGISPMDIDLLVNSVLKQDVIAYQQVDRFFFE